MHRAVSRQPDDKTTALAKLAVSLNPSAVGFSYSLDESQAQTQPPILASGRTVHLVEARKNALKFLARYPDSTIGYVQTDATCLSIHLDNDVAARRRELEFRPANCQR